MSFQVIDKSGSILNLAGPTGPTGATGPTGPTGPTGASGITFLETTSTGTGVLNDLDFSHAISLRMNNASLATIQGLTAPVGNAGSLLYITAVGAGQVDLAHLNTGSSAANRIINGAVTGTLSLVGGKGSAILEYDSVAANWRVIAHNQGQPLQVTYASGDYTATTGTWTVTSGNVQTFSYLVDGCKGTETVQFSFASTAVSSGTANVFAKIPGGFKALFLQLMNTLRVSDNGAAAVPGLCTVASGDTKITFYSNFALAAFSVSTGSTVIQGGGVIGIV